MELSWVPFQTKQKYTEPLFKGGTRVELKEFGFDKNQYGYC